MSGQGVLAMKKYRVVFQLDESGAWIATVPAVRGCHSYGRSLNEARERVREALALFVPDAASTHRQFYLPRLQPSHHPSEGSGVSPGTAEKGRRLLFRRREPEVIQDSPDGETVREVATIRSGPPHLRH